MKGIFFCLLNFNERGAFVFSIDLLCQGVLRWLALSCIYRESALQKSCKALGFAEVAVIWHLPESIIIVSTMWGKREINNHRGEPHGFWWIGATRRNSSPPVLLCLLVFDHGVIVPWGLSDPHVLFGFLPQRSPSYEVECPVVQTTTIATTTKQKNKKSNPLSIWDVYANRGENYILSLGIRAVFGVLWNYYTKGHKEVSM